MSKLMQQIVKFGLVGGIAFLLDYGVLYVLTEFVGVHYLVSGMISFTVSVIFNYIMSVKWVFDENVKQDKKVQFVVFIVLSAIGLGINQVIMWGLVDYLAIHYMLSKIFATGVVMVYNFVSRKVFIEGKG